MPDPIRESRALRRVRRRVETCSLRVAVARWIARRAVPAVIPKVNPLMLRLLRSPLHWPASRRVVVLRYEGRRTGRRYETPLAYRRAGDGALETVTSVYGRWWRNLEPGAPVGVLHRGRSSPARVDVVRAGGASGSESDAEAIRRAVASRDFFRRALMPIPVEETVLLQVWVGE